jgi:hypothetical protein
MKMGTLNTPKKFAEYAGKPIHPTPRLVPGNA